MKEKCNYECFRQFTHDLLSVTPQQQKAHCSRLAMVAPNVMYSLACKLIISDMPEHKKQRPHNLRKYPRSYSFILSNNRDDLQIDYCFAFELWLIYIAGQGFRYRVGFGFQTQSLHCFIQNMFTLHKLKLGSLFPISVQDRNPRASPYSSPSRAM